MIMIRAFEIEATPEELDASSVVADLLAAVGSRMSERAPAVVPADVVEEDDAEAGDGDGATAPVDGPSAIPGVAAEGQATLLDLLARNPAGDLFVRFLAETTSWPAAGAHGIKRKSAPAGSPLDSSRYLRLRKQGSQLGGFAYVFAADGLVNVRLRFDSDEELKTVASRAGRIHKGHPEYRVNIRITDEDSLIQAIDLARRAYDLT
ncbi:MAG: hypothetical protein JWO22_2078 [Frankiales bacterium]|nr:hypothetical protein [Frankiales bacterium]